MDSLAQWRERRRENALNVNVITAGRREVVMPASATAAQRHYVRSWLRWLDDDGDDDGADIVVEEHGVAGEIRVSFLGGDGQRQQMVLDTDAGGSYDEGPYRGEFPARSSA